MKLTYSNIYKAIAAGAKILDIDADKIIVDIFRDSTDPSIGYCCGDSDEVQISLNQHLNGNDWLEVLAHELIHARQYLTGRLRDESPFIYFEGKTFPGTTLAALAADMTDEEAYDYYRNTPWEVEAYDGQEELYNQMKGLINA